MYAEVGANMKKKLKLVLCLLILCVPFVVAYTLLFGPLSEGTFELIDDNVSAEVFTNEKTETFVIENKSIVTFSYDCNVTNGTIYSTIKDSRGEEIFTNAANMNFAKEWDIELNPGVYTYYLKCEGVNGTYIFRGTVKEVLGR